MNPVLKAGCAMLALACLSASAAPAETPGHREARTACWRKARFGMFIHYGPVSLTGIPAKIFGAKVLGGGIAHVRQPQSGIEISVAPKHRDTNDTVIALKMDSEAMKISALDLASGASLTQKAKA